MGFSFLGETRNGEHWVIADVRIKNFDKNVGRTVDHRGDFDRTFVSHHLQYWHFWGDFQNTM